MSWFDEVDSTGVVEHHIKQVLGLETSESKRILSEYQDIRQDLVDRISRYPRGTFTRQHLQGTLAQVQAAITAMNKSLGGETQQGAYKAALSGVDGLLTEMKVFDEKFTGAVTPINLNAALIAHDTSQLLVTRYKTNLDAYGNDLYTQISNGLFSAALGEATQDQVVGRISSFFNEEEWKLTRIVRTELHHVFNVGKMNGLKEVAEDYIPDMKKTLIHPMDSRTGDDSIYAATLGLIAEISDPFEYTWKGNRRIYMVPPDRPNDRSIMIPYRPDWAE